MGTPNKVLLDAHSCAYVRLYVYAFAYPDLYDVVVAP